MTATFRIALSTMLAGLLIACGQATSGTSAPTVDAHRSTLVAAPEAAEAGSASGVTVAATARDATGAPLAGRPATFSVSGTGAVFSTADAVTGPDGQSMVRLTSTQAGTWDLSVRIDGVEVAAHATATFVPGPPASLVFTRQPRSQVAGSAFDVGLRVLDAHGNAVGPVTVTLSLQGSVAGATLGGPVAGTTGADGVAAFDGLLIIRAGSAFTLVASAGSALASSAAFDVAPAAPSLADSLVEASPARVTAGAGTATVKVTLVDRFGNPAGGVLVGLSSSVEGDTLPAAAVTDADGIIHAEVGGTVAGQRSLSASAGGLTLLQTATLEVGPAAPDAAASSLSGPAASVLADGRATGRVLLLLRDRFGNAVPDAVAGLSASLGTLGAVAPTTGLGGELSTTLTSTQAGDGSVTATFAGGLLQVPVSFMAGPASSLRLDDLAPAVAAGEATSVTIVALDLHGNVAETYRGTVQLTTDDGQAIVPADLVFRPEDAGRRSAPVTLRTAGTASVVATDGTTPSITGSTTTTVAPGPATRLGVTGLPATARAGAMLDAIVTALDAFGNVATAYRGTIHFATDDPAGVVPGDLVLLEEDAGRRQLGAGFVLRTAGARSVSVADVAGPSIAGGTASLVVEAAEAARLGFTVPPSGGVAGAAFSPAVEVSVTDTFDNPVATPTAVGLVLWGGSGGASLRGTVSTFAVEGRALFADLAVEIAGRGYALVASSPGLPAVSSLPFDIAPGAPSAAASDLSAAPASLVAGATAALAATIRDVHGNPVPDVAVAFAASGSTNVLEQPAAPSDEAGLASGSLSSTLAEPKTVTATADAATLSGQAAVRFLPGSADAAGSTLAASPSRVPDDGTPVTLVVTVGDRYGNPVAGQLVTFSSSGAAALTQPAVASDAVGQATGSASALAAGIQTISASVGGMLIAQASVEFSAAPVSATASTVVVSPSSLLADGAATATATVTVRDGLGRAIPGASVTLGASTAATISPASRLTGATGVATFSLRSSAAGAGTIRATVGTGPGQVVLDQQPAIAFLALTYALGGQVYNLVADGLVLSSPGQDDLPVPRGATSFTFGTRMPAGTAYAISVKTQPAGEVCKVLGGVGTVSQFVPYITLSCDSVWKQLAAGGQHSLAVKLDGDLLAWGANDSGQLGDGTTTPRGVPTLVGTGFSAVAAGYAHSLALKANGDLFAWGSNASGQLGDGSTVQRLAPVLIGTGFFAISANEGRSMALKANGDLYAWGANGYGQLGDGSTSQRTSPVLVGTGFTAVAAGSSHTLGLRAGGALYAWGYNGSGQLGDGSTSQRTSPVLVGSGFIAVAAGSLHSLGLKANGELHAWGSNASGQLGDGSSQHATPTLVGSGYSEIAAGSSSSFGLKPGAFLFAWGNNAAGQLGDGTLTQRGSPTYVGFGFTTIAAGAGHTLALKTDGALYAWGYDASGQVGDDRRPERLAPALTATGVTAVAAGFDHALALKSSGDLLTWGMGACVLVSDGMTYPHNAPVAVGSGFSAIAAGTSHSLALLANGDVYAWGCNSNGQVGDGTNTAKTTPVRVGSGFKAIAAGSNHSLALKTNGDLYAWGRNVDGQLGNGLTSSRSSPTFIGTGFKTVAAGQDYSLAVKVNGDLYAWGSNLGGQLGDGTTATRSTPNYVGSGFSAVDGGTYHTLGVKANGELYAWGSNASGQLGDGTTTQRLLPTLVGAGFSMVAAGGDHSLAMGSGGALFAWGANDFGQLGDGSSLQAKTPRLVGTGFSVVSAGWGYSLALRTPGDLHAWGDNTNSQLGDGHGLRQPAPVPVAVPARPDYLSFAVPVLTCSTGVAVAPDVPTWSGSATAFTVAPSLPAGLTLDPASGILSGTPTTAHATTTYTVQANGPTGSTTSLITITVN